MKVLMIASNYQSAARGGGQVSLRALCHSLISIGVEVTVLALRGLGQKRLFFDGGVKVITVPCKNLYNPAEAAGKPGMQKLLWHLIDMHNPFYAQRLRAVLSSENPDVVHTHVLAGFSSAVWQLIKRHTTLPIVHTLRDSYLLCLRSSMFKNGKNCQQVCRGCATSRAPARRNSRHVDAVIGVSEFILRLHTDSGLFERALKTSIHNTRLPEAQPTPTMRAHSSTQTRFGFIGSLTPEKGLDTLLQAFDCSALSANQLVVAGLRHDGTKPPDAALVTYIGHVRPIDFFARIDVCVVPSLWDEPLGMVVAESLMAGVPVIVSGRGGLPEMVEDGVCGVVVPDCDVSGLRQAMCALSETGPGYQRMAEAAARSGTAFTDTRDYATRHLAVYEQVLMERSQ